MNFFSTHLFGISRCVVLLHSPVSVIAFSMIFSQVLGDLHDVLIIELSSAKRALQNIQNDCYEWLSDSCRVHQITTLPQTP